MSFPARIRLWLLFGAVIFAAKGLCSNDDAFEEMHQVDHRVYNRGLDHLPVLANRLLVRDVIDATLTIPADSPVVTANIALESTETLTSVVTETNCSRCKPKTTEASSETEPTVSETTSKKSTETSTVTKKSTVSATSTEKSTVSVTTTEHPSAPVAPTEEPPCSAGPTEPTTGPIPTPTGESTISGTATGKPTVSGTAIGETTVSGSAGETPCTVEPTGPTKGPAPVATKNPTQPSVGEHPGVPASSTHIEVTIPITPGQGGPKTLSTRITLATSKVGSGSPTPSQVNPTPHSTVGTVVGGSTAAIPQGSQGSGAGTKVPKPTGEAPHFTANPSPTYYGDGGKSLKTVSSCILAVGISLACLIAFL